MSRAEEQPLDLCIRNGVVVTATGSQRADVGVAGGRIAAVGDLMNAQVVGRTIDASGLLVMPGAIDTHTHMDMPTGSIRTADDFFTGTSAAAAGGVTTIIDFAIQSGERTLLETLNVWRRKAEGNAVIDYGFHVAVTKWHESLKDELPQLAQQGVTSLKAFMAYKNSLMLDDADLLALFHSASREKMLVLIHAENGDAIEYLQRQALREGHTSPKAHALTRPKALEGEATARAIALAEIANTRLFIVHVSCQAALEHIRIARGRGLPVAAETCPQYLGAIDESMYDLPGFEGAKYVCSPPLREKHESERMWDGLRSGVIQTIGSDHCPYRMEHKSLGEDDFSKIPNGIPGVETRVPLVWSLGVNTGRITPSEFVRLVATAPAELFGLTPNKGTLAVGADADLMLFDPGLEVVITNDRLHHSCDYTPYEGFHCKGYPVMTIARGDVVFDQGMVQGKRGRGCMVIRTPGHEIVAQ